MPESADKRSKNGATKSQEGPVAGYLRRNKGHASAKAWWNFFAQDLKERRVRYVTVLAGKMFSTMPVFLKDTHEINSYAARRYRPQPFPGKLTLFRALKQTDDGASSDNGWGPIFRRGIEIHEIPGDHWQVLSEPGIDVLAKAIGDCLSIFDKPVTSLDRTGDR